MDQPGRPPGSSLWNAQRAPRRVVEAPAARGRRGAAPALSLPACGLRSSLLGPRDLESVIMKQWRLQKPTRGPGFLSRDRAV